MDDFFLKLHSTELSQRLTDKTDCPAFAKFFDAHLRKILYIRNGTRYVAKNNYSVGRIEYLSRLYPDAHFVVPIRHPFHHVHSLVAQHQRFCRYAKVEPRVAGYLRAQGISNLARKGSHSI